MKYNIALLTPTEIESTPNAESFDIFEPLELEIFFINSFETGEGELAERFVRVDTKITQTVNSQDGSFKSRTERITHHTFPFAVWQAAVTGIDLDSGQPVLNETVLNQICATFGVKVI